MATFFEARLLDTLDQQLLSDLSKSYRNLLNCMNYRMITPYSDCPSLDDLSVELDELENLSIDIDDATAWASKKQQSQQKRKQQNKPRTSENDQINKTSPPKAFVDSPPIVTTSNQPKKRSEEEKWTSVSSKKGSKNNKASATSNNAVVSPNRPVIPGAVYSQKEAEKLAAARRAAEQEANNTKAATPKPVPIQPSIKPVVTPKEESAGKNPWKTPTTPVPVVSLKSTFATEKETTHVPKPTNNRPVTISSATTSIPIVQPASSQSETTKPWSLLASSPPVTSLVGYSSLVMASSPPPVSFKHIQDQETRAHEALRLISNKSLETIQTEELAIQALHRLYNSSQEFDMFITVERVTPEIANPIWPRTTASATSASLPSVVLITQKKGQK